MTERREAAGLIRTEVPFPTDKRDQMDALLASFNTTPKTVTYLHLPSGGQYINRGALHRAVNQTIEGSTWEGGISDGTLKDYCDQTLGPQGLVTTFTIAGFESERKAGYGRASAPQALGERAALLTLKVEAETGKSLYPVFGQTSTPSERENRAPFARAQILVYLSQKSVPVPKREIVDMLVAEGMSPQIAQLSLRALSDAEAISYESVKSHTGKVQVIFERGNLPLDEIQPGRYPGLNRVVITACEELIRKNVSLTNKNIYGAIPGEVKINKSEKALRNNVGRVIAHLSKQGYLKRGKYKGANKHSEASITEYGRTLVSDYLSPLGHIIDGNQAVIEQIDRALIPVRENLSAYAVPSINRFYRFSKSYKQANYERNLGVLEDFAAASMSNPEAEKGITVDDLADFTAISKITLRANVNKLVEQGRLRREKVGNVYRFFPADFSQRLAA